MNSNSGTVIVLGQRAASLSLAMRSLEITRKQLKQTQEEAVALQTIVDTIGFDANNFGEFAEAAD